MVTTKNDDESGVDELRSATLRLTEQVGMLSGALRTVNEVQKRQLDLAQQVKAVREDVQENAVPKHEFNKSQAQAMVDRQRLQTRIRIFAISMACLAMAVSIVASVLSYYAEKRSVESEHKARVAVCEQRNKDALEGSKRSKEFFAPYVDQEKHNPQADPVLAAILNAIANTPPQLLKCN